jgi:hypothetical protein
MGEHRGQPGVTYADHNRRTPAVLLKASVRFTNATKAVGVADASCFIATEAVPSYIAGRAWIAVGGSHSQAKVSLPRLVMAS